MLATLCFGPGFAAASDDDPQAKREQIAKLNQDISALKKELKGVKKQRSKLYNALAKSEKALGSLQRQIEQTRQRLKDSRKRLVDLKKRRQELQVASTRQQEKLAQQIRAAYSMGRQEKLKMLLNQDNPHQVARIMRYYDYLNKARTEQINTYLETIAELEQIEPQIHQQTSQLSSSEAKLKQKLALQKNARSERKQALAVIEKSLSNKGSNLKQLTQDRKALQDLVKQVEQAIAKIELPNEYKDFKKLKGKLPWPLKGKIGNSFGSQRQQGKMNWNGLMIKAQKGTSVKAIHHGRVVFSDWLRGHGLLIIVDHGDGYMSLYAHNQTLRKDTGDWVQPGDVIATVGNTGGQKDHALYFEIRHKGKPTNPRRWCKKA